MVKIEGDARGQLWLSYDGKRFAKVTDEYLAKDLCEQNYFSTSIDDDDDDDDSAYNEGWNDCLEECLDALRDISCK